MASLATTNRGGTGNSNSNGNGGATPNSNVGSVSTVKRALSLVGGHRSLIWRIHLLDLLNTPSLGHSATIGRRHFTNHITPSPTAASSSTTTSVSSTVSLVWLCNDASRARRLYNDLRSKHVIDEAKMKEQKVVTDATCFAITSITLM
jgi:hypothetical protein